ncbi:MULTISPECIES: hypothetical protein [unclassified Bacillus (in: firmicutes)]|uniref:hypothetical protein n=1 Tax=unclassified Bacillus (in: firmicutes) TaxID=185979 RepID=UPI000BF03109|nr:MULTISPECIES: hypothetical protein [unclassified Bacillus (in: firmicutes)]PEJ60524.1 hypothetical protein CN692_00065 [Bacillus sp. AFS002410]PEL09966.1 hypothetical protein CN601_15640 [Bacillus sp. AFS017336]
MNQKNIVMMGTKKEILVDIKKLYRIKPVTSIMVTILIAFMLVLLIGTAMAFGENIKSNYLGAFSNLFFLWNVGFGLFQLIWRFSTSRKINKLLFPKLEQFINESDEKSYEETEIEVYEIVKSAYRGYTEKYNKLNKIYWLSIKLSVILTLIGAVIILLFNLR